MSGRSLNLMAVKLFGVASKPLDHYPRQVRDTIGWVALITLFWASTVWVYLLFFHKPVESEIPENAPRLSLGEHAHAKNDAADSYAEKGAQAGRHAKTESREGHADAEHASAEPAHEAPAETSGESAHETGGHGAAGHSKD